MYSPTQTVETLDSIQSRTVRLLASACDPATVKAETAVISEYLESTDLRGINRESLRRLALGADQMAFQLETSNTALEDGCLEKLFGLDVEAGSLIQTAIAYHQLSDVLWAATA